MSSGDSATERIECWRAGRCGRRMGVDELDALLRETPTEQAAMLMSQLEPDKAARGVAGATAR